MKLWKVNDCEAWHTDTLPVSYATAQHEDMMSVSPICYRADPVHANAGCIWRPPVTMLKALARHKYPVVSVRVCRAFEIEPGEAKDSCLIWTDAIQPSMYLDALLGATGFHPASFVSVTVLDRSAA